MLILYSPSAQVVHTLEEVAPVAVEYLPALHCRHELALVWVWYSPVPQGVHTHASPPALMVAENPATQTQSVALPDPAADSVSSGQV